MWLVSSAVIFSEHYTPVFFSPSHHRLFFFFGQIKSFYQNCKTALIPLNSSHPERTVKNRSMCAETSALATPALVLTLLFSFHTTETLVLCPFPQDIRGDATPQEAGGKGRKESYLLSLSISVSRDQTG